MLTQRDILREWATSEALQVELTRPRAHNRLGSLFGHRDNVYRLWQANAALSEAPLLQHRLTHGWTWDGLDSRHIVVQAAGVASYYWVGVENRHGDWAHLPAALHGDDVQGVLAKWLLADARWHWAEGPRVTTCPWPIPGRWLRAQVHYAPWWFAAQEPNGNLYISTSASPWNACGLGHPIVAMAQRKQANIERTADKLMGWRIGTSRARYEAHKAVLKECYRVGAAWVRRVVVQAKKPLNPTSLLYEESYAREREAKKRRQAQVG